MKPSCILLYHHHCTECYSVTVHTRCETAVYFILLSRSAQEVKPLCWILHCHYSNLCETVVLNIALSHLTQNMKPSCILLCFHYCTEYYSITPHTRCESFVHNNLLSRSAQKVKLLCRILYCHESNTMWKLCAENSTVTTNTRCETFVQNIVLSRLTHALSGWLLLNVNSTIFHLYYGENKLIVNEMMMRSALFHGASSQKQQSKDRHVPLLGHIILIRAN
jgi:hypothetical protein